MRIYTNVEKAEKIFGVLNRKLENVRKENLPRKEKDTNIYQIFCEYKEIVECLDSPATREISKRLNELISVLLEKEERCIECCEELSYKELYRETLYDPSDGVISCRECGYVA